MGRENARRKTDLSNNTPKNADGKCIKLDEAETLRRGLGGALLRHPGRTARSVRTPLSSTHRVQPGEMLNTAAQPTQAEH